MGKVLGAAIILGLVIWGTAKAEKPSKPSKPLPQQNYTVNRCPTCGAPARDYGASWECTWCGDFGRK